MIHDYERVALKKGQTALPCPCLISLALRTRITRPRLVSLSLRIVYRSGVFVVFVHVHIQSYLVFHIHIHFGIVLMRAHCSLLTVVTPREPSCVHPPPPTSCTSLRLLLTTSCLPALLECHPGNASRERNETKHGWRIAERKA